MKIRLLNLSILLLAASSVFAQGSRSFKISEIFVLNPSDTTGVGLVDEYGEESSWIEITNTSYSTHDLRGCYLTNNKNATDKELSVPERQKLMSEIASGDARTNLGAKTSLVFYADGNTNRGTLHTNFALDPDKDNFIALFDGNAKTLIDSVTIPAGTLKAGQSYSRVDDNEWKVNDAEDITPNTYVSSEVKSNKVAEWKEKDPHGITMTIIAMTIVLGCLALLYVFFYFFGWVLNRLEKLSRVKAIRKIHDQTEKIAVMAKQGTETQGIEYENYVAAITLAMHEYLGGTHDIESGVLTIRHDQTSWNNKEEEMLPTPIKAPSHSDISHIKSTNEL